jgi:carboxyl-terminal processing protease
VLFTAVITGGWFLQQGVEQQQNVYTQIRLLEEVVDHVSSRFVDPVERSNLYDAAIEGVLRDLDDPNTAFLRAEDYENLRIRTLEGDYGGVGLEITERNGLVTVVTPLPGSPGTRAGVRAGDQIIEVDGENAEEWSVDEAVERLRGRPGTEVDVQVRRPGVDAPIPFTITRAVIEMSSVPFTVEVADGIGYVPLQIVNDHSSVEIRDAIASLQEQGLEGLILDLRGNPGGVLDEGIAISDLFLDPGSAIVETRGRAAGQNETFSANRPQAYPDLPIVVLVDERSASASEIVAGALQDHDRALVLGATSYGKGSVQTLYQLHGGNVLKLTTARWFTPSGRSIQMEDEARERRALRATIALDGSPVERSVDEDRPSFTSFGGRVLYGGGGISPDVVVVPDTLTTEESEAVRTIYRGAGTFNVALFDHAVRYLQDHPSLQPGFQLSDAELDAFYGSLVEQGLEVDREVFDRAGRYIRYHLGREIALQKWGEEGQFRRIMPYDTQLNSALELLGDVDSPRELFTVAGSTFDAEPARGPGGSGAQAPAEATASDESGANRPE